MSAQVYSVPGQAEGVLGMEKHRLKPYELLHERVMLTIIKVFINLFLLVRIGDVLVIFIINQ